MLSLKKKVKEAVETDLTVPSLLYREPPPSTVSLIDQVLDERRKDWPHFFRPSGIHGCDRQNVFHYSHAPENANQIDPKLHRILDLGTAVHTVLDKYLGSHPDVFFTPEVKVSAFIGPRKAFVRGSADGLVTRRSDGYRWVVEFKTMSPTQFEKLRAPKPEHLNQAMIYTKLIGAFWTTFVYFDKGGQNLKEYHVPMDDQRWQLFVKKVTRLKQYVDEGELPEFDSAMCKNSLTFCKYTKHCKKNGGEPQV